MARRLVVFIHEERCTKCGRCVDICPEELFRQADKRRMPRIVHQERCISCGHCVSICAHGAIEHLDFPMEG